ncbi:RHS repeat protein [Spirosoma validum]|uniref:RHS repeat protein n=1 Tax=Spirosoma validum TaxID=2771355 RepID=A0A927GF13_9BACT|nr:RHS repeat protein [Spirosoma validum]MBD2755392.1 RHS repeat protein [Spirosoma validum]
MDHQSRPISPLKVRLKTTDNVNFGGFPFKTEYNYDANNRVTSFTTSIGSKGVYQYDEQNRYKLFDYYPNASDQTVAEETYFVYNTSDNNFQANTGVLRNGFFEGVRESRNYILNANKRVLQFTGFANMIYNGEVYDYTGDNITSVGFVSTRVVEKYNYEYDDKPNTYYGLIAPDISGLRRFSRNNVTKIIRDNDKVVIAEYTYEYNAQGLPTKMKEKNGPGQVIYTYESY